jgi:hypothetical protein
VADYSTKAASPWRNELEQSAEVRIISSATRVQDPSGALGAVAGKTSGFAPTWGSAS